MVFRCGSRTFETKRELAEHAKHILNSSILHVVVGDDVYLELLRHHPLYFEKSMNSPVKVTIENSPSFGSRSTMLHRVDGSKMDISIIKCLDAFPTGRSDVNKKRKSYDRAKFFKTARTAIQSDIKRAKDDLPDFCALSGVSLKNKPNHIDHVKEFRILMSKNYFSYSAFDNA